MTKPLKRKIINSSNDAAIEINEKMLEYQVIRRPFLPGRNYDGTAQTAKNGICQLNRQRL